MKWLTQEKKRFRGPETDVIFPMSPKCNVMEDPLKLKRFSIFLVCLLIPKLTFSSLTWGAVRPMLRENIVCRQIEAGLFRVEVEGRILI